MPSVPIDTNVDTDVTLVAAPGERQFVRVLHWHVATSGGINGQIVELYSGPSASGTLKDGTIVSEGFPFSSPLDPVGLFDCAPGEALILKQAAGSTLLGMVRYEVLGPSAAAAGL